MRGLPDCTTDGVGLRRSSRIESLSLSNNAQAAAPSAPDNTEGPLGTPSTITDTDGADSVDEGQGVTVSAKAV